MIEHNFKKLLIWQEIIALVVDTYALTKTFPAKEKIGLISQLYRCAVSFPSNIAEGTSKSTDKHFKTYLETVLGSAFEWESQVIISHKLNYINDSQFVELEKKVNRIQNMIFKFKAKL